MMTDTEFMTAKEKELVLKQWKLFLRKLIAADLDKQQGADYGYFPAELNKPFTDRLYKHLSLHLGFIAHYNRLGFLSERFGTPQGIIETISGIENYGWGHSGYRDINDAMKAELALVKGQLISKANKTEYEQDMAQAKGLLAKHGKPTPF